MGRLKENSSIKKFAEKIYMKINYTDKVDFSDPDYLLIERQLGVVPEGRLEDFYIWLFSRGNEDPEIPKNITLPRFLAKIKSFRENLEREFWEEYKIEERASSLYLKISKILDLKKMADLKGEALYQKMKKISRDVLREITVVLPDGGRHPLFDDYDVEAVERSGGFSSLAEKILDPARSKRMILDDLERIYSQVMIDMKFLGLSGKKAIGGKDGDKGEKKVISLFAESGLLPYADAKNKKTK